MGMPYLGDFRVTKLYGTKPPAGVTYSTGKHSGIDLVGVSNKIVRAVKPGTVYKSGYDYDGWGKYTVIKQDDGLYAIYCHLRSAYKTAGGFVRAGDMLGIEGATGQVTGQHLHFELRKNYADKYSTIDPAPYLGIANKTGMAKVVDDVQETEVKVKLPNGQTMIYPGVIHKNQNLVSIRKVLEDLGYKVGWKNGAVTVDK